MIIEKYLIKSNEKGHWVDIPPEAEVFSAKVEYKDDKIIGYVYAIVDPVKHKESKRRKVIWLGTRWYISEDDYNDIQYYDFLGTYNKKGLTYHIWIEPLVEQPYEVMFDNSSLKF